MEEAERVPAERGATAGAPARRALSRESVLPLVGMLVLLLAGVGSAWGLAGGVAWRWLALGAGCWLVGVVAKVPVGGLLELLLSRFGAPAWALATVSGINSAAAELGVTALVFAVWRVPGGFGEALAVGVGAGAVEIVAVVAAGLAHRGGDESGAGKGDAESGAGKATTSGVAAISWSAVVERLLATAGHVASRCLVWVVVVGHEPLLAVAALGLFAMVDGAADYGIRAEWDWAAARTRYRYYAFVAVVTAAEFALLVLAYPVALEN